MKSLIHNKTFHKILTGALVVLFVGGWLIFSTHITSAAGNAVASTNTSGGAVGPKVDFLTQLGQTIGNMVLNVASSITWLGGMILEKAISELVLKMGAILQGSLGVTVNTMWTTVRDICNLAFIFGFIYIGIRTIIDSESAGTKKILASIIVGALLINFSLFFTKVIIDVSNYLAVEVHNTMSQGSANVSISNKFGDLLGIQTIYKTPNPTTLSNTTLGGNIAFYIMGAIFLIVAGFVLAAGGILLIVRFVALVFIMVFSPVLFAATIFPQTSRYASMLWSKLFSYAFFAPVYLFLLFVSMALIKGGTDFLNPNGTKTMSGALTNQPGDMFAVILVFIMAIMFLIMSLKVAQQLGVVGGDKVVAFGKDLRMRGQRYAGNATAGVVAATGRATVGRVAYNMSESDALKDRASKKGIAGWSARRQLKLSRAVADSSLDVRKIGGVGNKLGIGEGRQGGYVSRLAEVEEKEMKFAKSLGEVSDSDSQVKERKSELEVIKGRIKEKEKERSRADENNDKKTVNQIDSDLKELKTERDRASELYQHEKNRRVIGSTYGSNVGSTEVDLAKQEFDREQKNLQEMMNRYNESSEEEARQDYKDAIKTIKEQVTAAKKKYESARSENSKKDDGYVAVLKESRFYNAWPQGRMVAQEREAGAAIKKAFEKKIKESEKDSSNK